MTALPLCKYLSPVVITAANNSFRVTEGAASYTAAIAAGTYYLSGEGTVLDPSTLAATDLLRAIWVAAEAGSAGGWVVLYTTDRRVKMYSDADTWSIDWDNALTTFDATILGVADITAAFGGDAEEWDTTDRQHNHAWFASQPVEWYDGSDLESRAKQRRAPSGRIYTHTAGEIVVDALVRHAYEPGYKAREVYASGYENQSWQAFWRTACAGEKIRFYPDVSSTSYTDHVLMGDTLAGAKPSRYSHGAALYSWAVSLGAYV
jgi:hypothetical protein